MVEQENVQVVQQAFAAFGRGDIPSVLNMLTDDIHWRAYGPSGILPWAGTFRGPDQVGQFFMALGSTIDFQKFEPQEFIAQDDTAAVVAAVRGD